MVGVHKHSYQTITTKLSKYSLTGRFWAAIGRKMKNLLLCARHNLIIKSVYKVSLCTFITEH